MSKAVVLLSGGLDSAVCLYLAKREHHETIGLSFNYYGRRMVERNATIKLATSAGVELIQVDVGFLKEVSDIPRVSDQLRVVDQVYIPARNLIFYGVAAHFAERIGADSIYGGHIKTDALKFQDASETFFARLNTILSEHLASKGLHVVTPLINLEKHEVVRLGGDLGVPFGSTWSCYGEGPKPCGDCKACIERRRAFLRAGLTDPLG
ncbi:MAG: 7-cyano-7-deazaguanine synthase [Thermoprotei archaeon]